MLQLIQDIVYNVTGKQGITYETDFVQDLALKSFDVMNIISAFEDHFDTTIPTREVWHLHQVKDVIDYLAQKGFVAFGYDHLGQGRPVGPPGYERAPGHSGRHHRRHPPEC